MSDDTLWWLALPGEQPTGPYDANEIRRRVAESPGDWQVCRDDGHPDPRWRHWTELPGSEAGRPEPPPTSPRPTPSGAGSSDWNFTPSPSGVAPEVERGYLVLMHLSQFAGYLIPLAGIIVPLVLWLTRREDEQVDRHGREIMNGAIKGEVSCP